VSAGSGVEGAGSRGVSRLGWGRQDGRTGETERGKQGRRQAAGKGQQGIGRRFVGRLGGMVMGSRSVGRAGRQQGRGRIETADRVDEQAGVDKTESKPGERGESECRKEDRGSWVLGNSCLDWIVVLVIWSLVWL
jgi:hypothetical protein